MIAIERPDGTCFLIDSRPVSRNDYYSYWSKEDVQQALISEGPCRGQPANGAPRRVEDVGPGPCRLSDEFGQPAGMNWPPLEEEQIKPMVCVNWCDAYAYCSYLGKSLCQNRQYEQFEDIPLDTSGAPIPNGLNSSEDDWYIACSNHGMHRYPYPSDERIRECHQPNYPCEGPFVGSLFTTTEREHRGPQLAVVGVQTGCTVESVHQHNILSSQTGFNYNYGFRCCKYNQP
ncbi:MAG: SUMF1/EgtB/PvdO family nonheme iron enzyme [Bradymonadia bacterium]